MKTFKTIKTSCLQKKPVNFDYSNSERPSISKSQQSQTPENAVAIIKSGGEPVAVVDIKNINRVKKMIKSIWPNERVTVKIIQSNVEHEGGESR